MNNEVVKLFPGVFAERKFGGNFVVTEDLVNRVLGVILGSKAKNPPNYLRGGNAYLLRWLEQFDDVMMYRDVKKSRNWKIAAFGEVYVEGRTIASAIAIAALERQARKSLDSSDDEATTKYLALSEMVAFLRGEVAEKNQRYVGTSEKKDKKSPPKKVPEWLKRGNLLKDRRYTTSQLQGVLVDGFGMAPSNRAIHSAFKRRGIKPVGRTEGLNPESVWSGQKIREFISPSQTSLF